MQQIEKNVIKSFRLAKNDIIRLQRDFLSLSQAEERIMELLDGLKATQSELFQRIRELEHGSKPIAAALKHSNARKGYVASKVGKSYHRKNCPFAHNIKNQTKVVFYTKSKAENLGLKACRCVA